MAGQYSVHRWESGNLGIWKSFFLRAIYHILELTDLNNQQSIYPLIDHLQVPLNCCLTYGTITNYTAGFTGDPFAVQCPSHQPTWPIIE
ncbi:hypothetical protein VFPPC_04331 [Pochonia chlamydosporia 170]|uniref:Uncharacterized protein n=1 Tax=Pochonia chlamydosporia 170 TaxID=1380566 RepID=A0A179FRY8_METCM|nr:hypothetical protein VFPPC_04331 [Pochonia chlamydosporia 170]OAQ68018.2 hypothetical protein VFPPC_04331 [Pochonia chlamydosporia 170]